MLWSFDQNKNRGSGSSEKCLDHILGRGGVGSKSVKKVLY